MASQAKITVLESVVLSYPKISDNKIVNSSDLEIALPATASTLATTALTDALGTRIDGVVSDLASYATKTGEETLTNKTLTAPKIASISNGNATLTIPSSSGTLALSSEVSTVSTNLSTLQTKFGRLLDYLENWINVGNLSMADIKTSVNSSS